MSAVLQEHGREHVVLERRRVGERWRTERWESLRFQFPNWALELPGYAYSGDDPDGFAHWREVLRVIEQYAASTHAPVCEHTEVTALRADEGGFVLTVPDGTIHARRVVVATGPFQRPRIPQFCQGVAPTVLQTDPTCYQRPEDLPDGAVLVVGTGASGCQISDELLRAGRTVLISVSRHRRLPRRFRGQDVTWWLDRMGRFDQTIDSFPGGQWPPSVAVTGVNGGYDVNVRQMAADGIRVLGRVLGARDGRLMVARSANDVLDEADEAFAGFLTAARELAAARPDCNLAEEEETTAPVALPTKVAEIDSLGLRRENIEAIIWATGYDYDYGWLQAPVLDVQGRPLQQRGVTPVPGLYFLGLHWMHTFKSGLLSGVGRDAEYLAEHMALMPRP
ncbi:MAG: putative flavoprotein involved in transport [Solirubrobacteraceae bacterium]|nr:putative flavoprotein involved in transport [Solirubrobacteraceae bacterium]